MVRLARARSALLAASFVLLVACGGASTPTGTGPGTVPSATGAPASSTGSASGAPRPSSTPGPAASGRASGPSVPIDTALLALLPTTVAGIPLAAVADPVGTDDPSLVASVERMAQGYAVDPSSGDFVYASVIALRPGIFNTDFYRSWRDSFDDGACSQAGGVAGHAETTVAGRTVAIGRCDGGVVTYHVRLDASDTIVSVSSFGASEMGLKLISGLRP